tara:strand:+ start:3791 stop:4777 length:987 start_codon:yes stop_codon:yes gene_type:complete
MATIGSSNLTLADHASRQDPQGNIAPIVEVLSKTNAIIRDAVAIEGNLTTGNKTNVRAGLPTVYWRRLNQGVPKSKSAVVPVEEPTALMTAFSKIDSELVGLSGNPKQFRFTEDTAFMEAMNQKAATTMIYGNKLAESESFTGLAPRYGELSADNAENIIDAGGTGSDNTSIFLVGWDAMKTSLIFPKNTTAGLQMDDHGKQITQDDNGNDFTAWISEFNWRLGLQVRDWRYNARICNIDVSDLNTVANTKELITWMIMASERIEAIEGAKFSWYVNRTIREKLRIGIQEKIGNNLSWETVSGRRVMMFDDIEVGRVDAILNTEARVV